MIYTRHDSLYNAEIKILCTVHQEIEAYFKNHRVLTIGILKNRSEIIIKLIKNLSSFYIALILIVPFSVALGSFLHICLLYEKEEAAKSLPQFFLAAKLEAGLKNSDLDHLAAQTRALDGIRASQTELPIPEWHGKSDYEAEWQEMWKAYLSPVLYATTELRLPPPEKVSQLAGEIRDMTGVVGVVWDESGYQTLSSNLAGVEEKENYLLFVFFLFFLAVIAGLLGSFPIRFRRKYVVLTGFGGAGSQISPERVWLKLVVLHIVLSVLFYTLFVVIGYCLFPFSVQTLDTGAFIKILVEGIFIVAGLVTAICLVGWWFSIESLEELMIPRSPYTE